MHLQPVQLWALLAHLLFLRAIGGLVTATALADTFGTEAFLSLALVTALPEAFIRDMHRLYPQEAAIKPGAL